MNRLLALAAAVTALIVAALPGTAGAAGFHTLTPAMLTPLAPGASVLPIISVGDTLPSGYMFESIPDGISFTRNFTATPSGFAAANVYVNHELSTVPFPPNRSDFNNAMLSKLQLSFGDAGVLSGQYVIPSSANYQRFCSNFLIGPEHGSELRLVLTNEEARDIVLRSGQAWHPPSVSLSEPTAEQAGVVVAYDVDTGQYKSIYGMGRHNHENSVGIPGYGYPVILSGDDTFDAPASQVYLYKAANGAAVWNDQGTLYAFKSDNPAINDYGDLTTGMSVSGHFLEVPRLIATGKKADGKDITSADVGYPPPPTGIPDGPQWVLEHWSNLNNVFQFIRIEDTAYDRNDPFVHYLADTGEPRALANPDTGRLRRAPSGTRGPFMNGRIFKMVFDPSDPLKVQSLSILIDADAGGYNNPGVIHQPDNLETTKTSLLIQEDPGGHNQGAAIGYAKIWRFYLPGATLQPVAQVNQSLRPDLPIGSWESSGIIDASSVLGPGAFLVDVQAHGFEIATAPSPFPGVTYMRSAGQLLLFRLRPS
jgi:hypothetical protein